MGVGTTDDNKKDCGGQSGGNDGNIPKIYTPQVTCIRNMKLEKGYRGPLADQINPRISGDKPAIERHNDLNSQANSFGHCLPSPNSQVNTYVLFRARRIWPLGARLSIVAVRSSGESRVQSEKMLIGNGQQKLVII